MSKHSHRADDTLKGTTHLAPRHFDLRDLSRTPFLPISEFFNFVGARIFDEWSGKEYQAKSADSDLFLLGKSDDARHRRTFVEWQILQALELGTIEAFLQFKGSEIDEIHHRVMCRRADNEVYAMAFPAEGRAPPTSGIQSEIAERAINDVKAIYNADPEAFNKRFPSAEAYLDRTPTQDLESDVLESLEEFATKRPSELRLRVQPEAWAPGNETNKPINWRTSVGTLKTEFLYIDDEQYKLGLGVYIGKRSTISPCPTEKTEVQGFLRIAQPATALERFNNPPLYPKRWSAWGRQHFKNCEHFWPDYFSIIWALVAMHRDEPPSQSQLVDAVERELAEQLDLSGIGLNFPDSSTLQRAVAIVLEQYQTKTLNIRATGLMGRSIPLKRKRNR